MSKNPEYYSPVIGQPAEPRRHVGVIPAFNHQTRGVVTRIIAQNGGTGVAHILMAGR